MSLLASLHIGSRIDTARDDESLREALKTLILEGRVEKIAPTTPKHPMLKEEWFREKATGEVFRYVRPDFPARGIWELVEPSQ